MKRIVVLDYLRGTFAFLIMIYHFFEWSSIQFIGTDFLKVWSNICVPGFYILSGITLFLMYSERLKFEYRSITNFYIARVFRIFPLLWISIILTIFSTGIMVSPKDLFLNFTGLFSVFAWDKYIATGSWSIGNELFFYLCFPFLIMFYRKSLTSFYTLFALTAVVFLYFIFSYIDANSAVITQWHKYVNPLNHLFYFYLGVIIGAKYRSIEYKMGVKLYSFTLLTALFISIVSFTDIGDPIVLFVGGNRLILTLLITAVIITSLIADLKLKDITYKSLKNLGDSSYSIYLLHPFVFYLIQKVCDRLMMRHDINIIYPIRLFLFIILTLFLSHFVWKYVEIYFINLGKRLLIKDAK